MRAAWAYIYTVRALIAAVWFKLVVALGLVLFFVFVLWLPSFHFVPPISAKVVDAVSGKPLAGMNVCLEGTDRGGEETQTNASGRFSFSGSIAHTDLFQKWLGYLVRVTDPRMDDIKMGLIPHCGPSLGVDFTIATTFMASPRANLSPLDNVDRPLYFPVVADNETLTGPPRTHALERKLGFPLGGRIALIPLLKNSGECRAIKDPDLGEYCRVLNGTAVAAMLRGVIPGMSASE
jgi:hypothetical protein